jgi:hypothetical protein
MTLYDFFKNASKEDLAEFLSMFGSKLVYEAMGTYIQEKDIKQTEVFKDLYKKYVALLGEEII